MMVEKFLDMKANLLRKIEKKEKWFSEKCTKKSLKIFHMRKNVVQLEDIYLREGLNETSKQVNSRRATNFFKEKFKKQTKYLV